MTWGDGIDVHKRNRPFGLSDRGRWERACDDAAEDAIGFSVHVATLHRLDPPVGRAVLCQTTVILAMPAATMRRFAGTQADFVR